MLGEVPPIIHPCFSKSSVMFFEACHVNGLESFPAFAVAVLLCRRWQLARVTSERGWKIVIHSGKLS